MQKLRSEFERSITRTLYIAVSVGLLALFWQTDAYSHKTNLSRSQVLVTEDRVEILLTVSAHDLAVAIGIQTDLVAPVPRLAFEVKHKELIAYFTERLLVSSGNQACREDKPKLDYGQLPSDLIVHLEYVCPGLVKRLRLDYLLFFDIDPSHRGIGLLVNGEQSQEFLFDQEVTELEFTVLAVPEGLSLSFPLRIFSFGVEHILIGFAHLLFLILLLLVAQRFLELVSIVTAFTIAHSMTLALAWFDIVDLPNRLVEILIALSVAYVAAENIWRRRYQHRWLLVFCFGMLHGLGFYAVLRELDAGGVGAVTTLLAFNLGVEAGQLAVVAVAYPLVALFQHRNWYTAVMRVGSALIFLISCFWAIQRLLLG